MHKERILFMFRYVNKRVYLGLTRIWPTERNYSVIKSLEQLESTPMTNFNFCKNESQKKPTVEEPPKQHTGSCTVEAPHSSNLLYNLREARDIVQICWNQRSFKNLLPP